MARAETSERTVLLMADDDPADCLLTEKALRRAEVTCPLYVVHDGAELLDYLKRRGDYADPEAAPRPSLILLDLNMPKINGTEVLEQLRDEPELRRIPVVVLTTSDEERDIAASYALGANAYMVKPSAFDEMVSVAEIVKAHWLETVRLPPLAIAALARFHFEFGEAFEDSANVAGFDHVAPPAIAEAFSPQDVGEHGPYLQQGCGLDRLLALDQFLNVRRHVAVVIPAVAADAVHEFVYGVIVLGPGEGDDFTVRVFTVHALDWRGAFRIELGQKGQ